MNAIIDHLDEKEKAILHLALLDLKSVAETKHATAVDFCKGNPDPEVKRLTIFSMAWMETNVRDLINKLFGDTYVADPSYLDDVFQREFKEQNTEPAHVPS